MSERKITSPFIAIKPNLEVVEIGSEHTLENLKRLHFNQGDKGWMYCAADEYESVVQKMKTKSIYQSPVASKLKYENDSLLSEIDKLKLRIAELESEPPITANGNDKHDDEKKDGLIPVAKLIEEMRSGTVDLCKSILESELASSNPRKTVVDYAKNQINKKSV